MALSWNEIKDRALNFSKEWEGTFNEEADAKPFLDAFFDVFGITRRKIGTFEHKVKKLSESDGYIDLLWKGTILIEMKSRGKNLDKAFKQAIEYSQGLKANELPKYILVSDFENFRLYDTEEQNNIEFKLNELVLNVEHFGYLLGYQKKVYKEQDPANIKAAELMGKLHDRLEEIGYEGHPLEVYLVRILFCLFAEDTSIFNKQQFQDYIEQRTSEDGSDLAPKLQELFQVLNTSPEKRFKNLDEQLNDFPYVNGKLYEEVLPMASFDAKMRIALLECCYIDWSKISPAIFGSMFQSVMNPIERRNLGAHYTSEINIFKVIKPLFLDELWEEYEKLKLNRTKLGEFHTKLGKLKFLDPACGCGNFLIITYREIRLIELEVLKQLFKLNKVRPEAARDAGFDISKIVNVDVDQFYGIEYEEFPARIAEVAMWLIDHQMNMLLSNELGQYYARLPLKKSATILHGNALETDWESLVSKNELSFIIGNPPFLGHHLQNEEQKMVFQKVMNEIQGSGVLDYVTAWYVKSAKFIQSTKVKVALVSTNSITQGEQANLLWGLLLQKYKIKIHFAHRTFNWKNEAKGNAAVHCVIIGFANFDILEKRIFEYDNINGEAHEIKAENINPYLVDTRDILIENRNTPICNVPKMVYGSKPTDGGHFILTETEKVELLKHEPNAEKFVKKYVNAQEFLSNKFRYCLWLVDARPDELKKFPEILKRVELVKKFRQASVAESTRNFPHHTLFRQVTQPSSDYILIPSTTSERRKYIPLGFLSKEIILSNASFSVENATLYHFGILTSLMHMAWVKTVSGRLKSDFRYSKDIVYNNFPWPDNPNEKQIKTIELAAQNILDARLQFPKSSLADLYDPLTMPPALVKAHIELDKAVDLAYRPQPFTSDANRMEFLFELYEKYTSGLFTKAIKTKK